jgi:hypothetical protein
VALVVAVTLSLTVLSPCVWRSWAMPRGQPHGSRIYQRDDHLHNEGKIWAMQK